MRHADCPTAKARERIAFVLRHSHHPRTTQELRTLAGHGVTKTAAWNALRLLIEIGEVRKIADRPGHNRGYPVRWELTR